MGRFYANEADNYGGSGGSNFFSLKNDGDTAKVRFMYNSGEDVDGYAVHEIEVDDKKKYVNCLRSYNEPKSACPLCAANNFQKAKLYIPLYDIESGEVKFWERGKKFFQKMSSLCARFATADTPLVSHIFEIERNGKAGDTQTTYEIYEVDCDNTTLEDLPEVPDVIGNIILDKSADDLAYYAENGYFPNKGGAPDRERRQSEDMPTGRRTPSSRRTDRF